MRPVSPHRAGKVVQRPEVVGSADTGGGAAYRLDGVDGPRGGGDDAADVVIDPGSADVGVDLDTGIAFDGDAVYAGPAVCGDGPGLARHEG